MKQTKMVKFVFAILLLIPAVLLTTGIIQTFVIKNSKSQLLSAQNELNKAQTELSQLTETENYINSDQYLEDYYKNNGYDGKDYGKEGDTEIEIVTE